MPGALDLWAKLVAEFPYAMEGTAETARKTSATANTRLAGGMGFPPFHQVEAPVRFAIPG